MRGWPQYGGEGGALLWEKPTVVVVQMIQYCVVCFSMALGYLRVTKPHLRTASNDCVQPAVLAAAAWYLFRVRITVCTYPHPYLYFDLFSEQSSITIALYPLVIYSSSSSLVSESSCLTKEPQTASERSHLDIICALASCVSSGPRTSTTISPSNRTAAG